jgi:Raf kinase inhibitor-like YbhB/YbcL family protein
MRILKSNVLLKSCLIGMIAANAAAQGRGGRGDAGGGQRGAAGPPAMVLSTTAFPDGGKIPPKYSQEGEQVSPPLTWTEPPNGTRSFVVHVFDMDFAPNRGADPSQLMWLVWNIPGTSRGLPENVPPGPKLPDGSQQISASGAQYRGPGTQANGPMHHYAFEVYALDSMLDIQPTANALETRAAAFKAMAGHVLAKYSYVGLYRRSQ